MIVFMFVMSCLIFITTITWLSYKLGERAGMEAVTAASIGFLLSLCPPFGLLFIAYLAFKDRTSNFYS